MSASNTGRAAVLVFLALCFGCRREPAPERKEAVEKPRIVPKVRADTFADPGENAPITDLAVEAGSYHLLAISRPARKVGALHLPTGLWSWKQTISQQPLLVATHPVTGEGYLVWSSGREAGLTRFRVTTGDTLASVPLGAIPPDQFRAMALDPERNRLYVAADHGILAVDLTRNQPLPVISFEGPVDLALDPSLGAALIPHSGGGVSLLDLASLALSEVLAAPEGQAILPGAVVVDAERHRGYVLGGPALAEIDLEARKMVRWIAFDPAHDFHSAQMALAGSCGRVYLACDVLADVDVETGQWEGITELGQCPAAIAHAPALGALLAARGDQIYSAYHRCDPGGGP